MSDSKRLDWMKLWGDFRESISTGKASWGKNEILQHMNEMELLFLLLSDKELD